MTISDNGICQNNVTIFHIFAPQSDNDMHCTFFGLPLDLCGKHIAVLFAKHAAIEHLFPFYIYTRPKKHFKNDTGLKYG